MFKDKCRRQRPSGLEMHCGNEYLICLKPKVEDFDDIFNTKSFNIFKLGETSECSSWIKELDLFT